MSFARRIFTSIPCLIAVLGIGCKGGKDKGAGTSLPPTALESQALTAVAAQPDGAPLFTRVAAADSGVAFNNALQLDHPLARLYHGGFACGGVVMADFNGDGRQDLFFTSGPADNALYLQSEQALKFNDVTAAAGVAGAGNWAAGAAAADIDGDGDTDLLVANYNAANHLFINDGSGKFTDRAADAGLAIADASLMPTLCDYDRDGDLDIYIVTYQLFREGGRPQEDAYVQDPGQEPRLKPAYAPYYKINRVEDGYELDDSGRPDYLLRNDGAAGGGLPKFTVVNSAAGIEHSGFGLSASWWDYNDDGWPDLYVGNDYDDPDYLYHNKGDGTFANVAPVVLPHSPWFSMGSSVADVNGDGLDDLLAADMAFTTHYKRKIGMGQMAGKEARIAAIKPLQVMRNALYLNTGLGRMAEAAQISGLANSDWTWGVSFTDFDLDGRQDLFVANGVVRQFNHADHGFDLSQMVGNTHWGLWKHTDPQPEQNLMFRNAGELQFEEVGAGWGLDESTISHGIATGDLDGDGDADLVVTHVDGEVSIHRNDGGANQRIAVRLIGEGGNRDGIGARVSLTAGGLSQSRTLQPAGGYLTTAAPEMLFGLGQAEAAQSLSVLWPDGRRQEFTDLAAGKRYEVRQEFATEKQARKRPGPGLFESPRAIEGMQHVDRVFDDFSKQPLLPHKLSQSGPAMAWADIDHDGDDDLFLGNGRGVAGQLMRNDGGGNFSVIACPALVADAGHEDAAAAFFDANGDRHPDLYIVSGSYEYTPGDKALQDRLLLNDGKGGFTDADIDALPDLRDVGSCVLPCDFDKDGDYDLFIGGRVHPGEYPLPGNSRLLINDTAEGGLLRFVEAGHEVAPGLRQIGMVTDACWVDVDGNAWPDLVLTTEWGPVVIFKNVDGVLTDNTGDAGTAGRSGWWTRIAPADVDRDGDIDFAVGNFGLNTKYHASERQPATLYYGDFGNEKGNSLVEAEFEDGHLLPMRGRSCSGSAMPAVFEEFKSFHEFAGASLKEIYSKEALDAAVAFRCTDLQSGVLINDGSGSFEFRPLPRAAQLAPAQGFGFADFDGDGVLDLVMAQNFHQPQFETGPYDGGIGVLLKGVGDGNFKVVPPRVSGVLLPADARGLALVDFDGDDLLDIAVPINNGPMLLLRRAAPVDSAQ